MKFEIVILDGISGDEAFIYSVIILDEQNDDTLYDIFLNENAEDFTEEIEDIEDALTTMGNTTGLIGNRIIPFEGETFDDGIVAICNRPNKALRLYGIMFEDCVAIIGGGGPKQFEGDYKKDPKLRSEADKIKRVKKIIEAAELAGDIKIDCNGIKSKTNFIYDSKDYE